MTIYDTSYKDLDFNQSTPIFGFSAAGYRSFAEESVFGPFSKVNLFIGSNNSGKSNTLRIIEKFAASQTKKIPISIDKEDINPYTEFDVSQVSTLIPNSREYILRYIFQNNIKYKNHSNALCDALKEDNGSYFLEQDRINSNDKSKFSINRKLRSLDDAQMFKILSIWYDERYMGNRLNMIEMLSDKIIEKTRPNLKTTKIPAMRRLGSKLDVYQNEYGPYNSKDDIINRLAHLERPDYDNQDDHESFVSITQLLRDVLNEERVEIQIPASRSTINVNINGFTRPLEALGTGIHQLILLASECGTRHENAIFIEEPELHLHPVLQQRFLSYIYNNTSNQYFISTHSASMLDTPIASFFSIRHDGNTIIEHIKNRKNLVETVFSLGYRSSDVIQTNYIVWVEGPSDRIYVNNAILEEDSSLIEGVHYSIMFYGGRLLNHLSAQDSETSNFIELLSMNRNAAIIMDSDKRNKHAPINATKRRVRDEFISNNSFCLVTSGREIESYIPAHIRLEALKAQNSNVTDVLGKSEYDAPLAVRLKRGSRRNFKPDKIRLANYVVERYPQFDHLNWRSLIRPLVKKIQAANPPDSMR